MDSAWKTTKHKGKAGFDTAWGWFEKLGKPVNNLTNKIGSEAFWPTSLDKECEKAARILKSFCKDGFYKESDEPKAKKDRPNGKPKVLVKIPQGVIQDCVGLAIFSTFRTGLWVSGSGGSGVLIARLPDGSWSPPSGILVHTLGVGFNIGIDIYDCVVVINNAKALEAFKKLRVTLGGEVSVAAGPVGVGGTLDANVDPRKNQDHVPVFTYMKSRGLYAGVQVDGTFIVERNDENARFYGERVGVTDILAGRVSNVPESVNSLMEVAKSAEGRTDVDQSVVDDVYSPSAPGEMEIDRHAEPTEEQKERYGYLNDASSKDRPGYSDDDEAKERSGYVFRR